MNFFEKELRKITLKAYPDTTFTGTACYVKLDDTLRAKIQIVTGLQANRYNAIQVTILNRTQGIVDQLQLNFEHLIDAQKIVRQTDELMKPYITDFGDGASWYRYIPDEKDYQAFTKVISAYLKVFQNP